jgi:ABC-type Mn2+/Zn2+ transport system permease subunit
MLSNFFEVLISAIFVGGVCGYLGSLMLSRRMSVVSDPLSHLALPGAVFALIFNFDISLVAFLTLFFGSILIWLIEQKTKLSTEASIAIIFSISLAITFLFLEKHEIEEAIVGDISRVGFFETLFIVIICLLTFLIVHKIYSKLILISISEELAKSEKINIKKYQLLYLISISLMAAIGIRFVGALLIAGLIAIPAASARNIAKNLKSFKFLSLIFGVISSLLGVTIANFLNLPVGPLIIISSFSIFLICSILNRFK